MFNHSARTKYAASQDEKDFSCRSSILSLMPMAFWHIRILHRDKKSGSTAYSYEMDLPEDDVKTFAKQLQHGENAFCNS